ncbi:hypothetical protein NDU88_007887 [Pleurodeles waltl]|uniref:Uncharacterized protein n=1 Tax=Pleurodeles waltl TaxID=8319 RepID=A0AAV7SU05_PLEWA|nr:hypothetical protein NDU88_007887 [Pleurodeles waltl]
MGGAQLLHMRQAQLQYMGGTQLQHMRQAQLLHMGRERLLHMRQAQLLHMGRAQLLHMGTNLTINVDLYLERMYPKPESRAGFGLGGETEQASGKGMFWKPACLGGGCLECASRKTLLVSLQPPWGIRHERRSSSGKKGFWDPGAGARQ